MDPTQSVEAPRTALPRLPPRRSAGRPAPTPRPRRTRLAARARPSLLPQPDDLFLVTVTDGVTDALSDEHVVAIAAAHWPDAQAAARAVTRAAYNAGSYDNITTLVVNLGWNSAARGRRVLARAAGKRSGEAAAAAAATAAASAQAAAAAQAQAQAAAAAQADAEAEAARAASPDDGGTIVVEGEAEAADVLIAAGCCASAVPLLGLSC